MNINSGYFQIPTLGGLLQAIDRHRNPYCNKSNTVLRNTPVEVRWTDRAGLALSNLTSPLTVEMQVYFTCVVKKRVLFHEQNDQQATPVTGQLQILFNVVESTSCDPVEFANNFPVKRVFESPAAQKMKPSALEIDYKDGHWSGLFFIGSSNSS
ncbi:MAG: hypothetical protein ABW116_02460 [Candidatus Sedimenticola sp. 20ELBAFRAG]